MSSSCKACPCVAFAYLGLDSADCLMLFVCLLAYLFSGSIFLCSSVETTEQARSKGVWALLCSFVFLSFAFFFLKVGVLPSTVFPLLFIYFFSPALDSNSAIPL